MNKETEYEKNITPLYTEVPEIIIFTEVKYQIEEKEDKLQDHELE